MVYLIQVFSDEFLMKILKFIRKKSKQANIRGLTKSPFLYFGVVAVFLFANIYSACASFADSNGFDGSQAAFFNDFFDNSDNLTSDSLFFSQNKTLALETPDLKIIQDNSVAGMATPRALTAKVLGDVFGSSGSERKDIVEYVVQPGDTVQSIAAAYGVSTNTLLWANDLASGSKLKTGQSLVILPVSGLLHVVKSGDTIFDVAKKYKAKLDDIVAFNDLTNENDIYIGDILIVPEGVVSPKSSPQKNIQAPLADNFFIFPTQGRVTQGIHFYNAVDVANKCGNPVYAAASGVIQRVKYGYNFGGGNYITILHTGGITTYYGHLMTIFVKPGDKVNVGDRIGLIGGGTGTAGDGLSTGCHVHFQVTGAKNPLAKYPVGTTINLK